MASNWEEFYANTPKPENLIENESLMKTFVDYHSKNNSKIALVTSGGTTVPLEHNTVRFVDNFSAGTRGSTSAEHFLNHEYAVIFLHRFKSLEPYSRHLSGKKILDMLDLSMSTDTPVVTVNSNYAAEVSEILKIYKKIKKEKRLIQIGFTTLSEYLWLLKSACETLAPVNKRAILYLAAAVSDFYIPSNEMSVHKIHSTGPPNISLKLVPKMLHPLVNLWVPNAFIVSFKLETDENILIDHAREALKNYKHKLVIANMLQTRKQQVTIVSIDNHYTLSLTNEQLNAGEEIEKLIIEDLNEKHNKFIST